MDTSVTNYNWPNYHDNKAGLSLVEKVSLPRSLSAARVLYGQLSEHDVAVY